MSTISSNLYLLKREILEGCADVKSKFDYIRSNIIGEINKNKSADEHYKTYATIHDFTNLYMQERSLSVVWDEFLSDITVEPLSVTNRINSYIIFIHNGNNMYALAGGLGYHAIIEYCDPMFGIKIIERTFHKHDKVFKSMQDRLLIGNVLGSSKIFRNNANVQEEIEFGKMIKKPVATISQRVLREFGLDAEKDCSCFTSSGFKLTKSLTFNEYSTLCTKLSDKLVQEPTMELNEIKELKDENIISTFESQIIESLLKLMNGEDSDIEFEFTHKKIFKFMYADKLVIKKGNFIFEDLLAPDATIKDIMIVIKDRVDTTQADMWKELSKFSIKTYDNDNNLQTKGTLLEHVNCEVFNENANAFYLETKWYSYNQTLSQALNVDFLNKFEGKLNVPFPIISYDKSYLERKSKADYPGYGYILREREYNREYLNLPNAIVLDRVCPTNIEICDVLVKDRKDIYLIHVKIGFSSSTRDVVEQVYGSAKQVSTWIHTDTTSTKDEIGKLFNQAKKLYRDEYLINRFPVSEKIFRSYFTNSFKHVFCVAVIDDKSYDDFLGNIHRYKSNIAKYSLINLVTRLNGLGFIDMRLLRIRPPSPN